MGKNIYKDNKRSGKKKRNGHELSKAGKRNAHSARGHDHARLAMEKRLTEPGFDSDGRWISDPHADEGGFMREVEIHEAEAEQRQRRLKSDGQEQWDEVRDEAESVLSIPTPSSNSRSQALIEKQKSVIRVLISRNREIDAANRHLSSRPGQTVVVGTLAHVFLPPQFYLDRWGTEMRPLCTAMKIVSEGQFVAYLDYYASHFDIHQPLRSTHWCFGCMMVFDRHQTERIGSFPRPRVSYENLMSDLVQAAQLVLAPTVKAMLVVPNFNFSPSSAYYAQFDNYWWSTLNFPCVQQLKDGHSWMSQTGIIGRSQAMDKLIVPQITDDFPLETQLYRSTQIPTSWAHLALIEDSQPSPSPVYVKTRVVKIEGEKALVPFVPNSIHSTKRRNRRKVARRAAQRNLDALEPQPTPSSSSPTPGLKGGMIDGDDEVPIAHHAPDYRAKLRLPEWCSAVPPVGKGYDLLCLRCGNTLQFYMHDLIVDNTTSQEHMDCWGWQLEQGNVKKYSDFWGWDWDPDESGLEVLITPAQGRGLMALWASRVPTWSYKTDTSPAGTKPGMREGIEENPGPFNLLVVDLLAIGAMVATAVAGEAAGKILQVAEDTLRCFSYLDPSENNHWKQFANDPVATATTLALELKWIHDNPVTASTAILSGFIVRNGPTIAATIAHTAARTIDFLSESTIPTLPNDYIETVVNVSTAPYKWLGKVMRPRVSLSVPVRLKRAISSAWNDAKSFLPSFNCSLVFRRSLIHTFELGVLPTSYYITYCYRWFVWQYHATGGHAAYMQRMWAKLMHSITGNGSNRSRNRGSRGKNFTVTEKQIDAVVQRKLVEFRICREIISTGECDKCHAEQNGRFNPQLAIQTMRCCLSFHGFADPIEPSGNYIGVACLYLAQDPTFAELAQRLQHTLRAPALPPDTLLPPLRMLTEPITLANHTVFTHPNAVPAVVVPDDPKATLANRVATRTLELEPESHLSAYGIVPGHREELNLVPAPKLEFTNPSYDIVIVNTENWAFWASNPDAHPAIKTCVRDHMAEFHIHESKDVVSRFASADWSSVWGRVKADPWSALDVAKNVYIGPSFPVQCSRFLVSNVTNVHPTEFLSVKGSPVLHDRTPVVAEWRMFLRKITGQRNQFVTPVLHAHGALPDAADPLERRHRLPLRSRLEPHPSNIHSASVHCVEYYVDGLRQDSAFYIPEAVYNLSPTDYDREPASHAQAWARLDGQHSVYSVHSLWRPHIAASSNFYSILKASREVTIPIPTRRKDKLLERSCIALSLAIFALCLRRTFVRRPGLSSGLEINPGP